MSTKYSKLYTPGDPLLWTGRVDSHEPTAYRWHQDITCTDLLNSEALANAIVFLGFCCDEGVRRNQGRVGAAAAPEAIRKILANLPVHHARKLVDAGNVICLNGQLEEAQECLAWAVAQIRVAGAFPIILGGGHEVTYGHYSGLRKQFKQQIGILNIDAHFDLRETVAGTATSGTGFYQIAEDLRHSDQEFHYLAFGIQQISNTKILFDRAHNLGVKVVEAQDICASHVDAMVAKIRHFAQQLDAVYLTIDLDAFASPYAPGVSALAFNGIVPDSVFYQIYTAIISLPNLISMDIAELNPIYDIDNRTARLAADLIFKMVSFG